MSYVVNDDHLSEITGGNDDTQKRSVINLGPGALALLEDLRNAHLIRDDNTAPKSNLQEIESFIQSNVNLAIPEADKEKLAGLSDTLKFVAE